MSHFVAALGTLALLVGTVQCSSPSPPHDQTPCSTSPKPTFRLTVRSIDGVVPSNTWLEVEYSSGVERFEVKHPDKSADAVFCSLVRKSPSGDDEDASGAPKDAGADTADGGPVTSVSCELWTDGPATLTAQGGNYPLLKQNLVPKNDECGIMTTAVEAILGEQDAGTDEHSTSP